MDINGKIIQILEKQSGPSKNGANWEKQDFILETDGQYPKKVCFNLWGDKIQQFPLSVGDVVTVSFDIESREYNGRWYTDVRGWKAVKTGSASTPSPNAEANIPVFNPTDAENDPFASSGGDGDLPF